MCVCVCVCERERERERGVKNRWCFGVVHSVAVWLLLCFCCIARFCRRHRRIIIVVVGGVVGSGDGCCRRSCIQTCRRSAPAPCRFALTCRFHDNRSFFFCAGRRENGVLHLLAQPHRGRSRRGRSPAPLRRQPRAGGLPQVKETLYTHTRTSDELVVGSSSVVFIWSCLEVA